MLKETNQQTSESKIKESKTTQQEPESESRLYGKYDKKFFADLLAIFQLSQNMEIKNFNNTCFHVSSTLETKKTSFKTYGKPHCIHWILNENNEVIGVKKFFYYNSLKNEFEQVSKNPKVFLREIRMELFFKHLSHFLLFEDKKSGISGEEIFEVQQSSPQLERSSTTFNKGTEQFKIFWENKELKKVDWFYRKSPEEKEFKLFYYPEQEVFLEEMKQQLTSAIKTKKEKSLPRYKNKKQIYSILEEEKDNQTPESSTPEPETISQHLTQDTSSSDIPSQSNIQQQEEEWTERENRHRRQSSSAVPCR